MVDSRQRKLNIMEIVTIALENTKSQYPLQVALPAIITEMSQPNTKVQQFGNTIFVLHQGQHGGMFKALNADTAPNFVQNSIQFLQMVKQLGLPTLVTDFQGEDIRRMIKLIAAKPPFPGMGMQIQHTNDGGYRATINMGGAE